MKNLIFDGRMVPRIKFGCGVIKNIADEIKGLKGTNVLLVCDAALSEIGLTERIARILQDSGLKTVIFDKTEPEPSLQTADACSKTGRDGSCDFVVGVGGGSAMDTAKAAGVLLTNEGPAQNYQGQNLVNNPGVNTIMVPTTAGTGSEVTVCCRFDQSRKTTETGHQHPLCNSDAGTFRPGTHRHPSPTYNGQHGNGCLDPCR